MSGAEKALLKRVGEAKAKLYEYDQLLQSLKREARARVRSGMSGIAAVGNISAERRQLVLAAPVRSRADQP